MPIFLSRAILDRASPSPPSIIAPAWPMRFSGGAEIPAIYATIGRSVGVHLLLREPADFSNDDDGFCLLVFAELCKDVGKRLADHRVSADADDCALSKARPRQFIDNFVRERAAPGNHSDMPSFEQHGRHDPHLDLAWRQEPRAVRSDNIAVVHFCKGDRLHRIVDRDVFRDCHDERKARPAASMIESPAAKAGTKTTAAPASCSFKASFTLL